MFLTDFIKSIITVLFCSLEGLVKQWLNIQTRREGKMVVNKQCIDVTQKEFTTNWNIIVLKLSKKNRLNIERNIFSVLYHFALIDI